MTRRRARPGQRVAFGGRAWRVMRLRVLERDGYLCQWCLADGYRVRATTADHIIPRAHGGTQTEANLVAACERCNYSRRDSLGPPTWRKKPAPPQTPAVARWL